MKLQETALNVLEEPRDFYIQVGIENTINKNKNNNLTGLLDKSQLVEKERKESSKFRIYGYITLFANSNYNSFIDINSQRRYFNNIPYIKKNENNKNFKVLSVGGINFSFLDLENPNNWLLEIYYPFSSAVIPSSNPDIKRHVRNFRPITSKIEVKRIFLSKTILDDPVYYFSVIDPIDTSLYIDYLGRPLSEVFLNVDIIPNNLGGDPNIILDGVKYPTFRNQNDLINVDLVEVNTNIHTENLITSYTHTLFSPQLTYKNDDPVSNPRLTPKSDVFLQVPDTAPSLNLTYSPLIPIRLQNFSSYLSYEESEENPPLYSEEITLNGVNTSSKAYRELLPVGVIESESFNGVDHPFLNGCHYVEINEFLFFNYSNINSDNSSGLENTFLDTFDYENPKVIEVKPTPNSDRNNC